MIIIYEDIEVIKITSDDVRKSNKIKKERAIVYKNCLDILLQIRSEIESKEKDDLNGQIDLVTNHYKMISSLSNNYLKDSKMFSDQLKEVQ